MTWKKTVKKVFQNTALAVFSIIIFLFILEGGLRVSGYLPGNPFERLINHYDPFLGYRMVPGMHEAIEGPGGIYNVDTVSIGLKDGVGFRDDGVSKPVFSVFIGDSFVWGYGVDLIDSVSEKFEQLSGKDSVNLGMTSYTSPTQYARVFDKYGTVFHPQYLFLGFFVGNDFGDTVNFSDWENSQSTKSYPEWLTSRSKGYSEGSLVYKIRISLYNYSSLYRFLSERINFSSEAARKKADTVHVNLGELDIYLYENQLYLRASGLQTQTRMVKEALIRIRETGAEHSIRPVVFIIPTKEMVYQDFFPNVELREAVDQRYSHLIRILDGLDIPYIDLLPIFRERVSDGQQLYFKYDGHWNAEGHRLAAESIRDFLATDDHEKAN